MCCRTRKLSRWRAAPSPPTTPEAADAMPVVTITEREFSQFQRFIYEAAGICMANGKQALVSGRLAKRLAHYQLESYGDYLRLLESRAQPAELQVAVDLLTTNETYFFREPKHFALLRELALEARDKRQTPRVWSAASSSGEEAYSIAMVLADVLDEGPWEVLGTYISTRVLERARCGHYPLERASQMPPAYLKRFCLKGQGSETGTLLIERPLRPGGYFLIGHSETLNDINDTLVAVAPSIYRKP